MLGRHIAHISQHIKKVCTYIRTYMQYRSQVIPPNAIVSHVTCIHCMPTKFPRSMCTRSADWPQNVRIAEYFSLEDGVVWTRGICLASDLQTYALCRIYNRDTARTKKSHSHCQTCLVVGCVRTSHGQMQNDVANSNFMVQHEVENMAATLMGHV